MKLIIINGLPATGKTTIAKPLSKALGIPLIAKDTIKEFLFDELGTRDRAWSSTLGKASADILYQLASTVLADGQSIIVENAFYKQFAEPQFQAIITKYNPAVLEIYCFTEPEIRRERFVNRHESGNRHKGHADHENYPATTDDEPHDTYAPLEVGALLNIDTGKPVNLKMITAAIADLE